MKSLAELAAIKEKMKHNATVREDGLSATRIVVGMATCGIA
ncbi:MAG: (2Fe-2S) ferredoxin domain-containing protein, partial [Oscillospiraceae bacterium]|nr:(2Fe-2S) ferredoxin domain-containing protein [Oscillospiraceae bacterium]